MNYELIQPGDGRDYNFYYDFKDDGTLFVGCIGYKAFLTRGEHTIYDLVEEAMCSPEQGHTFKRFVTDKIEEKKKDEEARTIKKLQDSEREKNFFQGKEVVNANDIGSNKVTKS